MYYGNCHTQKSASQSPLCYTHISVLCCARTGTRKKSNTVITRTCFPSDRCALGQPVGGTVQETAVTIAITVSCVCVHRERLLCAWWFVWVWPRCWSRHHWRRVARATTGSAATIVSSSSSACHSDAVRCGSCMMAACNYVTLRTYWYEEWKSIGMTENRDEWRKTTSVLSMVWPTLRSRTTLEQNNNMPITVGLDCPIVYYKPPVLRPSYRSTCLRRHLLLRTRGFYWCSKVLQCS